MRRGRQNGAQQARPAADMTAECWSRSAGGKSGGSSALTQTSQPLAARRRRRRRRPTPRAFSLFVISRTIWRMPGATTPMTSRPHRLFFITLGAAASRQLRYRRANARRAQGDLSPFPSVSSPGPLSERSLWLFRQHLRWILVPSSPSVSTRPSPRRPSAASVPDMLAPVPRRKYASWQQRPGSYGHRVPHRRALRHAICWAQLLGSMGFGRCRPSTASTSPRQSWMRAAAPPAVVLLSLVLHCTGRAACSPPLINRTYFRTAPIIPIIDSSWSTSVASTLARASSSASSRVSCELSVPPLSQQEIPSSSLLACVPSWLSSARFHLAVQTPSLEALAAASPPFLAPAPAPNLPSCCVRPEIGSPCRDELPLVPRRKNGVGTRRSASVWRHAVHAASAMTRYPRVHYYSAQWRPTTCTRGLTGRRASSPEASTSFTRPEMETEGRQPEPLHRRWLLIAIRPGLNRGPGSTTPAIHGDPGPILQTPT